MILKKTIFPVIIILAFYFSCEQYTTGFNYDTQSPELTRISGIVSNKFTDENVKDATIRMNNQETRTGEFGEYVIHLAVGTDQQRDKPVEVEVTAENYLPFLTEFILYPESREFDIPLEYAAPIVLKNALGVTKGRDDMICQVLILDYQGYSDIDSVEAIFYYSKSGVSRYEIRRFEMDFVRNTSDTTAFYEAIAPFSLEQDWGIDPRKNHEIYAVDKSGYSVLNDSGVNSDTLLFPSEY